MSYILLAVFLPSQVYNITSTQMLQIQMYLQTAYISVRNSWSNLVFSQKFTGNVGYFDEKITLGTNY